MASSSDINSTSSWVKYFTEAGIPHNIAANYAVTFVDNRITKSMLLDLSKEILQDMGIGVMGDIIAILKHAKVVHAQMTRDKVFQEESPVVTVPPARRSTQPNLKHKLEEEEIPMKKVCKIIPEKESNFVVSLPSGNMPKSSQMLNQQASQPSVFGRLAQKVTSGPIMKPLKTRVLTKSVFQKAVPEVSPSVFDRLGPGRGQVSSTTVTQEDQNLDEEAQFSQLQYKGILKSPALPVRTVQTKAVSPVARPNIRTTVIKKALLTKRLGLTATNTTLASERIIPTKKILQAATVSSCSEGILATGAKSKKALTVKNRLGPKTRDLGIRHKPLTMTALPDTASGSNVKVRKMITYTSGESVAAAKSVVTNQKMSIKHVKKPVLKKVVPVKKPSLSVSFVSTSDVFSRLGPAMDDIE